jgi:hypothetical protein
MDTEEIPHPRKKNDVSSRHVGAQEALGAGIHPCSNRTDHTNYAFRISDIHKAGHNEYN